MNIKRRDFIKSSIVIPAAGLSFPVTAIDSCEPDKWVVEPYDFDFGIGVGAAWGSLRHAAHMPYFHLGITKEKAIEICKNRLRLWYLENKNGH